MNAKNSQPMILLLLPKSIGKEHIPKAPSWYIHNMGMGTGGFVNAKPIRLHIHTLHLGVKV